MRKGAEAFVQVSTAAKCKIIIIIIIIQVKSSQVELYCHSTTCVDI